MKPILLTCLLMLAFEGAAFSQAAAMAEFAAGKVSKFSTRGHAKAKGVDFTINYPASWAPREGKRPNVVQVLVDASGAGAENALIVTKELPPEVPVTPADIQKMVSMPSLRDMTPPGATFLRGTQTTIEGEPAGILEYSVRQSQAGSNVEAYCTMLVFAQGRTMVQVQFMVGGLIEEKIDYAARAAAFKPLFQLMMNSIVFDEKWKKR